MKISEINKRRQHLKEALKKAEAIRHEAACHCDAIAGELQDLNALAVIGVEKRIAATVGKPKVKV